MLGLVLCFVLSIFVSVRTEDDVKIDRISQDCNNSYSMTCLKLNLVNFVDKMNEQESYSIIPGVSLVRESTSNQVNTADIVTELAREFPNDAEARLDAFLLKKVGGFLSSHSMKLDLWNGGATESDTGTARKGSKGGGGLAYLLAAGAMMKGTLLAVALGGLAALAGKALMTAMISLMLSAIIGLKSLTSHGGKETTYEIISKPEEHGHYGHRRSLDLPLPLGLQSNYTP
ncbi:hypothetical protein WA026_008491 [Henosepilachna vigintioctopunctata]|uniref:Osiris 16 n=1 Tax=Henosepilachna vigintioctopunctata TaxID=420089 RepID=A0AAW1UHI0_9CUCU